LLAGHGGLAPKETFPKARAAAKIALEIDPNLAEAYASLGFINYRFDWQFCEAEENFKRAIELKPNYSTAHHWYGEALASAGRFEESLNALQRSQDFDPLSIPISTDLAQTLYFARRYEECEAQLRKTLEMDPQFIRAHIVLGTTLEQLHRYDEALASLQLAVELSKNNSFAVSRLGNLYALMGRKREAQEILRFLKKRSNEYYASPYDIAVVYAGLGDKDKTFEWLEKDFQNRDSRLSTFRWETQFESLINDPRFNDLLKRMNLPQ